MRKPVSFPLQTRVTAMPSAATQRGNVLVGSLALLLALAAGGGAGYLWLQSQQVQAEAALVARQTETRITDLARNLENTERARKDAEASVEALRAGLDALRNGRADIDEKLAMVDQRLVAVTQGPSRVDWLLSEVVQYVTLAERRLSLSGDVQGGVALLEAAEQAVAAMGEPSSRTLRQAILDDLARLRLAEAGQIDTEQLFLRLNSLKKQVVELQPSRLSFRMDPVAEPTPEIVPEGAFAAFWYKFTSFLQSLYRYRDFGDEKPQISVFADPAMRFQVQQSVISLLDQAQLAVLRGETRVYAVSLADARDRIQRYMRSDTPTGEAVLTEVTALQETAVKQAVPDIAASLAALNVFRQAWEKGRGAREAATLKLMDASLKRKSP
jgi:uroporphyrin-3 C-methyltransferase